MCYTNFVLQRSKCQMNQENLKIFIERTNTLIETKVILADKAISTLLKCVVSNEIFLQTIKDTLKEIPYATEFSRARATITQPNGTVLSKLKLPQTDSRIFTFVICLLTEFDSNKRNLLEFLQEFFTNEDANVSYKQFAVQILKPFKKAGEHILRSLNPLDCYQKEEENCEQSFFAEHIYINQDILDNISEQINNLTIKLETEMYYSQQEKADVNYIINAFSNALLSKNPRLIKIIWIGVKNTLKQYKSIEPYLRKINTLLVENNLI